MGNPIANNPIIKAFDESLTPGENARLLRVSTDMQFISAVVQSPQQLDSADPQVAAQLNAVISELSGAGEFTMGLIRRLGEDGIKVVLDANVFDANGVNTFGKLAGSAGFIPAIDQRLSQFDSVIASLRKEPADARTHAYRVAMISEGQKCALGVGAMVVGLAAGAGFAYAEAWPGLFFAGAVFGAGAIIAANHCHLQ